MATNPVVKKAYNLLTFYDRCHIAKAIADGKHFGNFAGPSLVEHLSVFLENTDITSGRLSDDLASYIVNECKCVVEDEFAYYQCIVTKAGKRITVAVPKD